MSEEIYDNSKLVCFSEECEAKYFFKYEKNLVPNAPEAALAFGQGIHAMCDQKFKGKALEKGLSAFLTAYPKSLDEKRTVALGEQICRDYYQRYENEPFDEVIFVEGWKEIVLEGGIRIGGRIDKLVKWLYGITPVDHKTSSKYLSQAILALRMKYQFTGYLKILKEYMEGVGDSLLVDLIHVPRPLKTKVAQTDFCRELTPRGEFDYKRWEEWVVRTVEGIRRAREDGVYRCFDNDCDSWNRVCPYKVLCEMPMGMEDTAAWAKKRVEEWKVSEWKPWEED
jgi:hypothetical protein